MEVKQVFKRYYKAGSTVPVYRLCQALEGTWVIEDIWRPHPTVQYVTFIVWHDKDIHFYNTGDMATIMDLMKRGVIKVPILPRKERDVDEL
jgi:hypothetical protein